MKRRPVILDVDTGVDDALAIMLAFRSAELDVQGILTVSGNVHVSRCTANTLTVLDHLEAPPIPVAAGAAAPLARVAITAAAVHGWDGLGGVAARFPPSHRPIGTDAVADLRRRSSAASTAGVCVEVEADRFLRLFTERVLR